MSLQCTPGLPYARAPYELTHSPDAVCNNTTNALLAVVVVLIEERLSCTITSVVSLASGLIYVGCISGGEASHVVVRVIAALLAELLLAHFCVCDLTAQADAQLSALL